MGCRTSHRDYGNSRLGKKEDDMATYRQDDDHDRMTHMDMLSLLRQDMREGFARQQEALAQQREVFNTRFDALDSKVDTKVDALDSKVDTRFDVVDTEVGAVRDKIDAHIAEHTAQANESKTARRWIIGLVIAGSVAFGGLLGQYLPAIIQAFQSGG